MIRAVSGSRYDGGNLAGHVEDILALAKQAHAAGDAVLARSLLNHAKHINNDPMNAHGSTTLVLRDGRRVPVHEAAQHIRRGGKPAGTVSRTAGGSPLAAEIRRISAQCRKLASEADQRRIGATLAQMNAPAQHRQRLDDTWDPDEEEDREIFGE